MTVVLALTSSHTEKQMTVSTTQISRTPLPFPKTSFNLIMCPVVIVGPITEGLELRGDHCLTWVAAVRVTCPKKFLGNSHPIREKSLFS